MTITKSTIALALLMGFATISFADNKNEAKETGNIKSEPVESKATGNNSVTAATQAKQSLFWYSDDGSEAMGQGEEPDSPDCALTGEGCAKGYTSAQPIPVPETAPVAERRGELAR